MNNFLRPYKSDIKQINTLINLGCNESDISSVLGITEKTLTQWKESNTEIGNLLKPKARPEFTLSHPDFAHMVEEAFVCGGRRFYRFKEEYRMATGRYTYYYATLREVELKLTLQHLQQYVDTFKLILNGGSKKKSIDHHELHKLIINLESRISLAFDVATIKKLAAVAYFDDTEDITSFSDKYGQEKIKLWDEHNYYGFFLMKPIGELLNVKSTFIDSLPQHLTNLDGVSQDLTSDLLKVIEDNS